MKCTLFFICVCVSSICFAQNTGAIEGFLTEKETASQPLSFANVFIKGTSMGTITDFDGAYKITNIPPGNYTVVFSFVGYETQEIPNVHVTEGTSTELSTSLGASAAALDQVVITTVARDDSPVALLLEQRKAVEIKESIGAVELAKLGVSDAATATTKISGVTSSEESGNLYVRGLGDRYLYTTMNGLPIPSDNVERKNIDLALFPTRVVQSISIGKTFAPETSADQSSGNINIQTRELLGESEFGISLESGINTSSVQKGIADNFRQSPNMDDVSFGFYSKDISTRQALTEQSWDPGSTSLPINYEYTLTAGKRFGEKFEILFTGSHSGEYEYREGVYRKFRRNNRDESFDDVREWITTIENTALLNLGYEFNNKHRIKALSLFINKLSDNVYEAGRNGNGYVFEETDENGGLSQFRRDQNTKQTRLWINQLIGEHDLSENNKLDWAIGYNLIDADEPNRIRNEINLNENLIEFGKTGGFQQRKSSQKINDRAINARLKDALTVFEKDSTSLKVLVGGDIRNKQRDFSSKFLGIKETRGNALEPVSLDNISGAFTQENLDAGLFQINELQADTYNAELQLVAGFASINYAIGKFNFNLGARYQNDEINVGFNVGNYPGRVDAVDKSYDNIYPSLNVKYALNERNNFRLAASKTITLPEFKEIAPFQYVDATGEVTVGNPDLAASTNYNLDLKWEFFPSNGELISMTGFYKQINDPINRVQQRGSAGNYSFFNSGKKAEIYGLELDTNLGLIASEKKGKPSLDLGLNATRMWHSQDLKNNQEKRYSFRYKNLTEVGLQGASEWIFNASLNFSTETEHEFLANISANYASDKIYALGAPEIQTQSDIFYNDAIVEKGFVMLNALFSKELNDNVTLEFKAKNLLNPKVERTQLVSPIGSPETEQTVESYRKGMVLSLEVGYSF